MAKSNEILIEDLVILAASLQSGTDVTPIRLIAEIRQINPDLSNVLISQMIDDLDNRSVGQIRPPHDEPGESAFLIDFRGVEFARNAKEKRSLRSRLNRNFFPAFNAILALVGATAAVAAAYFSYLGLSDK